MAEACNVIDWPYSCVWHAYARIEKIYDFVQQGSAARSFCVQQWSACKQTLFKSSVSACVQRYCATKGELELNVGVGSEL